MWACAYVSVPNDYYWFRPWAETTIFRFPLLEWAESTIVEFNTDCEVGITIRLRGLNRLGRTIRWRGPNPLWAEPSGTPFNGWTLLSVNRCAIRFIEGGASLYSVSQPTGTRLASDVAKAPSYSAAIHYNEFKTHLWKQLFNSEFNTALTCGHASIYGWRCKTPKLHTLSLLVLLY